MGLQCGTANQGDGEVLCHQSPVSPEVATRGRPFCCADLLFEEFSPSQPSALVPRCVLPALLMAAAPCATECEGTTVVENFSLVALLELLKH